MVRDEKMKDEELSTAIGVKRIESRYIMINEDIFDALSKEEIRVYMALRYESDYSKESSIVKRSIDFIVEKVVDFIEMVECKFHPRSETNSDVKIPMYILSRFNDLKDRNHPIFSKSDKITGCWIATNNRFTSDAMDFANCSGLKLLSWDYPPKFSLRKKIDEGQLYPITCLTTLTIAEKDKLMVLDVILAREIIDNAEILEKIGLSPIRIKNVIKEASELCKYLKYEN